MGHVGKTSFLCKCIFAHNKQTGTTLCKISFLYYYLWKGPHEDAKLEENREYEHPLCPPTTVIRGAQLLARGAKGSGNLPFALGATEDVVRPQREPCKWGINENKKITLAQKKKQAGLQQKRARTKTKRGVYGHF